MEQVKSLLARKVAGFKELFNVPPMSESMAVVIILFVFTNSVATSIWMSNAWTPFIFTLFEGSNVYVGLMSAVHGIFDLVFAMITGHFADTRFGPSRTLIFAVRFGFFNLVIVMLGMWSEKLWVLILSQCSEGIYMGLSFTCMESVFAQCVKRGDRDRLYSLKFSCEAAGPIVGIFLTLILYAVLGDHWEVPILRAIMTFGVGLHMISMISFLYYFKPLPWTRRDMKGGRGGGAGLLGEKMQDKGEKEDTMGEADVELEKSEGGCERQPPNTHEEEIKNDSTREERKEWRNSGGSSIAHTHQSSKGRSELHSSGILPNSSAPYSKKGTEVVIVDSSLINEDHRAEFDEEDLMPVEEGSTINSELVGPSTEYANRARTAIISSSSPRAHTFQYGKYELSTCTPAPEAREEVLSEVYQSFSGSFHSINIRSANKNIYEGADYTCENDFDMNEKIHTTKECARDDASLEVEVPWMFSINCLKGSNGEIHHEEGRDAATNVFPSTASPGTTAATITSTSKLPASAVPYTKYVDTELNKAVGWKRWVMKKIPFMRYPIFVALSDFIITLGSGMTTQYFTLFMMKLYNVDPTQMALLNLSNSCIITILAIVVGAFGRRHGRVRAILPPKMTGALILLWMALARGSVYAPKWLMCIAFAVRGALMNCSSGLSRALIMDLVPEHLRGRWNAVESLQSAGWSGTALFGGYLADRFGYGTAFIFTFFFHVVGISVILPLAVRNDTKLPVLVVVGDTSCDGLPLKEVEE